MKMVHPPSPLNKGIASCLNVFEPNEQGFHDRAIEPSNDWGEFVSSLRLIFLSNASFLGSDSSSKMIGSQFELAVWFKRVLRQERTKVLKVVLGQKKKGIYGKAIIFIQYTFLKWTTVEQDSVCSSKPPP